MRKKVIEDDSSRKRKQDIVLKFDNNIKSLLNPNILKLDRMMYQQK